MKTADYPVWLAVMPDQRDAARADAGKHPDGRSAIAWDKEAQLWYARPGADLSRLQKWLPDRSIRSSGGGDPQEEFLAALTSAGLVIDGLPVMNGRRQRVPVVEGKKGNRDGVYRGFLDGVRPGGWYINYHRAENDKDVTNWKGSGREGKADPVARLHIKAAMQQARDDAARKQAALYARQTASAKALYARLPAADPTHAYLVRKGITVADDVRQTRNGALVVPFYDVNGGFRTLQYIPPDGEKYLYKDAPKSGHFRVEGGRLSNGEPILYAEGYATARSLHMVTGRPVVMTIDAGNMETVASVLKARYPDSPHLFMADVDHAKERNKGVLSANRAAAATGGAALLPDLTAAEIERGFTDYNDLHQSRGAERLQATLLPTIASALEGLNYKESSMATPDDAQPAPENTPASEPAVTIQPEAPPAAAPDAAAQTPAPEAAPAAAEPAGTKSAGRPGSAKAQSGEILALSAQGMKPAQIAEQLGIGQTSVYRILRAQQPAEPEAGVIQESRAAPAAVSGAEPAVTFSPPPSDAAPEPAPAETAAAAPAETAAADQVSRAARAAALSGSGLSLARVAAEMNLGMGETHRLIEAGKQQQQAEQALSDTASDESGAPEAWQRAEPQTRPQGDPSPAAAAFGIENGILVGAPRVAPSDEDLPDASGKSRIDADKLLSRVTHEKQADGKSVLYRLDGEPAFVDHGNRLVMASGSSAHGEKVLAALLTAANHYHGRIELTGSDEFKAFAIGVIVANKLNVTMKNAGQQADLDAARRAAGQPVAPADAVRGDPPGPRAAETPPAAPVTQADNPAAAAPVTPSLQQASAPAPAEPKISPAVHTPAEKAREPVTGKVTACGQAPFRFETGQSESTFITLRTKEGTQTYWGKELAGVLRETNLQPGRMVTLQWMGEQPVTINKPVKDLQGNFTGQYEKVPTKRNRWSLAPAGGSRVQSGSDDMVPLAAVDVNRYTQIQHTLVSRLGLDIDAPPKPADGLYWIKPDGQGSHQPGDPLSAPRPAHNERAGAPVMSAWGDDGRPDLLLVQGDGDYLQGVVRQNGIYNHVLVSLPGSKDAPPMVVNVLTSEGAQPIGNGNGINRSSGQPVPREHVVIRLSGDDKPRIAKLDAPAEVPATLHARLGYDERYKAESGWVKEQPAAAPQAAPATPPRPAQ
ncbi:LPD7 domain-containing protein [Pantoea dispersa]|uniref:LPD7 domain-containing protein n=1 Tax=Pantoea dispersa TaxID=59814 RepID=UPI001F51DD12|nr:LPD7 domain-containing protein [Pantoea dispersa]MCI1029664.1 helix-turn-helix domain-containing protein [Pantoea dispersa]